MIQSAFEMRELSKKSREEIEKKTLIELADMIQECNILIQIAALEGKNSVKCELIGCSNSAFQNYLIAQGYKVFLNRASVREQLEITWY